jgi:hypothetical protein
MNPTVLALRVRFALLQMGIGNLLAILALLLVLLLWQFWLPHERAQLVATEARLHQVERELKQAPKEAPPPEIAPNQQNLDDFYDILGGKKHAEQQLKTLFAIAKKQGLVLAQGEYKASFERNGQFYKYQIILPVKGQYGVIRQFCEQVLLAIPFASLDELNFKRDSITNRVLEAKLRFTLHLASESGIQSGKQSEKQSGVQP